MRESFWPLKKKNLKRCDGRGLVPVPFLRTRLDIQLTIVSRFSKKNKLLQVGLKFINGNWLFVSLDCFDTYSIDKYSHGAKDVGAVTGLDIHRDNHGSRYNSPDWAFDYVSNNNNIQHLQNKTKEYIHLDAGCLKLLPP